MKKYELKNSLYFIEALSSILISTLFAVCLQFFKGNVLDYAVIGDASGTFYSGVLL